MPVSQTSSFPTMLRRLAIAGLCCLAVSGRAAAEIIYATSFSTGQLIRFDSANPAGTRTVLSGAGSLKSPSALAYGPDGNLYIGESGDASTVAPRISRFNLANQTLSVVHTFAGFDVFPGSLAFTGNDLLVGRNPFFDDIGPIMRIVNATGGLVAASAFTSGGNLSSSPGLAIAADGTLYVSDQTYNTVTGVASGPVKRFDAAGTYIGEFLASGSNGLSGPTGLVIGGSTLFTASIGAGTILQTNLATGVTQPFSASVGAFEVGALARLTDGSLLAGSPSGSGNIYRFNADGSLSNTFASGLGQVGGVVVAPVPEPSAALLAAAGAAGIGGWMRRRRTACPR